jgi:RNA polymerase sigma factor (sigma-70 family)
VSKQKNLYLESDQKLVFECLENNQLALKHLYERFSATMLGILIRYAKDTMEAEDMLQEGFIRVFNNLHQYRYEGSLSAWVRRIMINTAINYYKSNLRYNQSVDIDLVSNTSHVSVDALDTMSEKHLIQLIKGLPEGYRMVFNLYIIEGYSHKEIAKMLNISENTSKSQLSRARKSLQNKIEQYSQQPHDKVFTK